MGHERRSQTEGVDEKVERSVASAPDVDDYWPPAFGPLDVDDVDGGGDIDPTLGDGAVKGSEESRPVDGERPVAGPVEADVEGDTVVRLAGAIEPFDRPPEPGDAVDQTELAEDVKAGRLQEQARADGARLVEPLEKPDAVTRLIQEQRCRQARGPASRNGDVHRAHPGPPCRPAKAAKNG